MRYINFKVFHERQLRSLFICLSAGMLCLSQSVRATETDAFTFAKEDLRDISPLITNHFKSIIEHLGADLEEADIPQPDAVSFSRLYKKYELKNNYFSSFESCVLYENCAGWHGLQRLFLDAHQSVYGRSDYDFFTTQYLSPSINVCGTRIGSDKLTHIFNDGFRMFEIWSSSERKLTDWDIALISLKEEHSIMGGIASEVISFSDVQANLAGLRLFRDLFFGRKNLVHKGVGRGWTLSQQFDLCHYVFPSLDEGNSAILFVGDHASRLLERIRTAPQKFSSSNDRSETLSRRGYFHVGWAEYYETIKRFVLHPIMVWSVAGNFFAYSPPIGQRRLGGPTTTEDGIRKAQQTPEDLSEVCRIWTINDEKCSCVTSGVLKSEDISETLEKIGRGLLRCQVYKYGWDGHHP